MSAEPAIVVHSAEGTIIGWDERAEQLLGYRASEIVGQPYTRLLPDDAAPLEPVAERELLTKRGQPLPVICRRTPVTDGSDRVLAISEVIVTRAPASAARAAAIGAPARVPGVEAQETVERARLAAIVAAIPGVVLSFREREGQIELSYVSAAAQAIYGFSPQAIMADGSIIVSRFHADDVARARQVVGQAVRRGEPFHWDYRYHHPTLGERWFETHFMPAALPDGSLSWNGVVLDITQRRRNEDRLSLTEAQLESALDAVQMGAWIWDPQRGLVWGNESQRRIWSLPEDTPLWYDPELARGRIHPDDLARVDAGMERARAGAEPLEMEFRILRGEQVRWISMRARSEQARDGARRVVGINIDVTQQKLAAETALRSQKLEALGTLAGGIAHDFNNVLFAIAGNAAVALRTLPTESPAASFLQEVTSASSRASELVRQILAYSRPEEQRLEVLSLVGPVQEALKLARSAIPALVSIRCEVEVDTPMVRADASRIVQVVINLCTNAAHAIGRDRAGTVEVALRGLAVDDEATLGAARVPQGRYAVLSVSDDGCGMDEATLSRIFDPFFTTKPPGEGTGLGLSMVHGIVKALSGIITVYSQPQKGSTFRLYFPAAEPAAPLATEPVEAPLPGRGQRILFVDDELMLVHLGTSLLELLGYRPDAHQDAREALAAFRREPEAYSAVVTDLSMPSMSGFDLTRALLAIRPDLPIVVMSGYSGPHERALAEQLGVAELVLKPITMNQLSALLARLC